MTRASSEGWPRVASMAATSAESGLLWRRAKLSSGAERSRVESVGAELLAGETGEDGVDIKGETVGPAGARAIAIWGKKQGAAQVREGVAFIGKLFLILVSGFGLSRS